MTNLEKSGKSFLGLGEELQEWEYTPEEKLQAEAEEKELEEKKKSEKKEATPPEGEPLETTFVARADWDAGPHAEGHEYLEKPILHVRFWKYTDTASCTNKAVCKKIVKEIQERHKSKGFGDISHNFLLGGDGNVYEGRGWDFKAPRDTRYKYDKLNYLDIAFIGDERKVKYDNQTYYQAAFRLLNFGRKMKLVSPDVAWTWEE